MSPKCLPKGSQINPKMAPEWSPDGSKMVPKWLQMASWRPLGHLLDMGAPFYALFCPPVSLLERSWGPPGPKKRSPERLLGAPRGIPRQVSAILGAKRLQKRSPGGSKMGSQIGSWLKKAKSQKMQYILHENLNFEGPGLPKTGLKRVQN